MTTPMPTVAVHKHRHTAPWGRKGSPHTGPVLCHVLIMPILRSRTPGWNPRDYLIWFPSLVEAHRRLTPLRRAFGRFHLFLVRSAWNNPNRTA